jgi:hypothetical protein
MEDKTTSPSGLRAEEEVAGQAFYVLMASQSVQLALRSSAFPRSE